MPQRVVLLHLGAHRTGTTYLQYTFRANADKLLDRGVRYMRLHDVPALYEAYISARHALLCGDQAEFERRFAPVEDHLRDFRDRYPAEHLLISYEGILGTMSFEEGFYPERAALLDRFLAIFQGEMVLGAFAVRDPAAFLESSYSQLLHTGHSLSFGRHIAGLDLLRLSWLPVIDTLTAALGDRLAVWSYEDFCKSEIALLEWLFRRSFGISGDFLTLPDKSVNPSLSAPAARMVAISNRLLGRNPAFRTATNRRIRKLLPAGRFRRRSWLDEETVANLRRRYSDDLRDIRNRVADVYEPPLQ